MTGLRGCAVALLALFYLFSVALDGAAAAVDGTSRKLLQGRPWQQGWQPGNSGNRGPPWGQGQGQGSSAGAGSGASAGKDNSNRPNPNRNRGDVNSLSRFTGGASSYRNRPRQTIAAPTSGPGLGLYQGLRKRGNAKAAANSLAETFGSNQEAAATSLASAATDGGNSMAVAEAVAATSVAAPNVAAPLLAKSATLAVDRGQTQPFAATMANSFAVAKQQNSVPDLTRSITGAVSQGGAPATLAFGEAIATAVAQGGDSKAAVAEATATAFCEGGSTAQSWSNAFAIALSKDSAGCLVLNEAKAMAKAKCGPGVSESISKAEASSVVLGFCGLLDFIPGFDFNFGSSQSGGSSWGG